MKHCVDYAQLFKTLCITITNGVFYSNRCYGGGCAIFNQVGTDLYISNSTFVYNASIAPPHGPVPESGAIEGGGATIYNSIFRANAPDDLLLLPSGKGYDVFNSLIRNYDHENNNFFEDPEFVLIDEYSTDFHLRETSPCIDRADDSKAPERDFDGNKRVDIPGIGTAKADVGAYEYVP